MGKWVINSFISEDDVKILAKENLLQDFANCSKSVVIDSIIEYIESADADGEVKGLLSKAYSDKLFFLNVQQDEIINNNVEKVYGYNFYSVNAGLTIEELEQMKQDIKSVYNDDLDIPYINPISGDVIANIINTLLALHRVNKKMEYKKLAYILGKNKDLFRDKANANSKGTIFKKISKRSMDFEIMLRGIDFLIEKKKAGCLPESWRLF